MADIEHRTPAQTVRGERLTPAAVRLVNFLVNTRPEADETIARRELAVVCRSAAELDRCVELFTRWKAAASSITQGSADE